LSSLDSALDLSVGNVSLFKFWN